MSWHELYEIIICSVKLIVDDAWYSSWRHFVVPLFVLSLFLFHIHVLVYKLLLRSKRLRKASSRCPLLIVIKVWPFIKFFHLPTLLGTEGADVSAFSIYAIVSKNSLSFVIYSLYTVVWYLSKHGGSTRDLQTWEFDVDGGSSWWSLGRGHGAIPSLMPPTASCQMCLTLTPVSWSTPDTFLLLLLIIIIIIIILRWHYCLDQRQLL